MQLSISRFGDIVVPMQGDTRGDTRFSDRELDAVMRIPEGVGFRSGMNNAADGDDA